jgi:arylsulfatase A-like enzyme
VGHGGTAAQPFIEGASRGFNDRFSQSAWMSVLRSTGFYTASVSSFPQRHSAWHWYAGYREVLDPGRFGVETAPEVNRLAVRWLEEHAREDNWFLHVNYWDPHTPYRTPEDYGDPFAQVPLPVDWLTEDVQQRLWSGYGPHSAQEPQGWGPPTAHHPRMPDAIDSMDAVKRWIDGYDTGIRYTDDHIAGLLRALDGAGVLDETAIIISADHGDSQGELNVWGDHQTADSIVSRVPLVVRWPGISSGVHTGLRYQIDWAATLLEMAGAQVPSDWDAEPFTNGLSGGRDDGRPYLVISQGAWTCMRSVRWDDYLCMRTYHDGYQDLKEVMLYDVGTDPHLQRDLAAERPDLVDRGMSLLTDWQEIMMLTADRDVDPMMTVLREGGPWQVRGQLPHYLARLRATGRDEAARRLEREHGEGVRGPD